MLPRQPNVNVAGTVNLSLYSEKGIPTTLVVYPQMRTQGNTIYRLWIFPLIYHISGWCKWHFKLEILLYLYLTGGEKLILTCRRCCLIHICLPAIHVKLKSILIVKYSPTWAKLPESTLHSMNHKDSSSFNVTRNHIVRFSWFTLIIALTWITLQHKLFSDWSLNLWDEEDNSYGKNSKLAVILVIGWSFHSFRIKIDQQGDRSYSPSLWNWNRRGAKIMTLPLFLLPVLFQGFFFLSLSEFWEFFNKKISKVVVI